MSNIIPDQAQPLRELVNRQASSMKIVTIASGKGGVGKSTISVNLAIALSKLGIRPLVIDADFGLANVDVMLGVNARYNLSHMLRGERKLSEIIQEGHQGVRFISGGSGVFELLEMDENQLTGILSDLLLLDNPADIVLLDSGAGINENVLRLIAESSETIVVTTPEPTAILDAYALIKTVLHRDSSHAVRLLMNKCDNRKEGEAAIAGFQKVIGRHLGTQIDSLGYVLYDNEVPRSIKQMTPLMISSPNGTTSRDIMSVAQNLMDLPTQPGRGNLLTRLFSRWRGR